MLRGVPSEQRSLLMLSLTPAKCGTTEDLLQLAGPRSEYERIGIKVQERSVFRAPLHSNPDRSLRLGWNSYSAQGRGEECSEEQQTIEGRIMRVRPDYASPSWMLYYDKAHLPNARLSQDMFLVSHFRCCLQTVQAPCREQLPSCGVYMCVVLHVCLWLACSRLQRADARVIRMEHMN